MQLNRFQLIDAVERLDVPARRIVARARVPVDHEIFAGHFPGYPVMPGVLLVECMAQTAGQIVLALGQYRRMPFLAEVRSAKLRRFVPPGAEILAKAEVTHEGSGYAVAEASIECNGEKAAQSELMFRTAPFPSEETRAHMLALIDALGVPRP